MIVVVQLGLPTPVLAPVVSMFMELPVRSRLLLARSRVRRPHSCLYTRWELRLLAINIGQ
jgi:hypothetical protein